MTLVSMKKLEGDTNYTVIKMETLRNGILLIEIESNISSMRAKEVYKKVT